MAAFLGNVLFLCTGNSARSIMAEALLDHWAHGAFKGYSAGSHPKGDVHPMAIETLRRFQIQTLGLRSKSWDEFAQPDAPPMQYIITVCDQAAGEVCPIWPGQPIGAHWGVPDPAAVTESIEAQAAAFREALLTLQRRIQFFLTFRFKELKRAELKQKLEDAGKIA